MKSLIDPERSPFMPSSLTELEDCSDDSVYAPGYVQPHGILLVLQEPDLTIVQVSETVASFWGLPAEAVLGRSLQELLPAAQVKPIADALRHNPIERCNPFKLSLPNADLEPQTFRGALHRIPEALLLELEPAADDYLQTSLFHHSLQSAMVNLRSATTLPDLAQTIAREIKVITKFDRVMIYRFEADEHGVVMAEEKEPHLESYLGLHYPATDVPLLSRKLFCRNWVRTIPDTHCTHAQLIPTHHPLTQAPLDLSDCVLRGVHPAHIEYLQNMGVAGSLTISLIDEQRLWGLIACHHYSPKLVDYETRKTCEFLGQFASIELVHQQERELNQYRVQVKAIQDRLQQAFTREPSFIEQGLTANASQLMELVQAEGMAIVLNQTISRMGRTPAAEDLQALMVWLAQQPQQEIYVTDSLARVYPPARAFKDKASGLLKISMVLHQTSYHLIWFRPEQIQTVNWAGDPRTTVVADASGEQRLTPRKSFALWKETVAETSRPWENAEIEAAMMMRNILMLAVLEFSQTALEQAAERATIANRAKSQFLAKMSHELRTPLNAILGFAQVMNRSSNIPAEFQEHLSIISRSGEHLLALINDVLEMSRIEAGQLVLTERCFNLYRLLHAMEDLFTLKASQKGLTMRFERDPTVPRYGCGDEAKLRQILINLISNAIKFTAQGEIVVRARAIALGTTRHPGCPCYPDRPPACKTIMLLLEVQDNGCGIAADDADAIFEAFVQTEQGRYAEGTGLGLSISRQFARLMGGDLTVQSQLNEGSTFLCQVLLHEPESIDLIETEAGPPVIGLEPGPTPPRILVVEDLPDNRQLLLALLEPIGFDVCAVANGVDAIARWQDWQPHLILMDIQMPVMDGYEATRHIRKALAQDRQAQDGSSSAVQPIIIALTAYAFEDDRTASLQAGCDDYLTKPFTDASLFEIIARHLGVSYRYADSSSELAAVLSDRRLSPDLLRVMPPHWRFQVHEAALDLNDAVIRQLMAEIPQSETTLIEGLSFLVDNFQLEAIANLTQSSNWT